MSVRFKFRSSVGFDSIELGARSFISLADLRDQIVKKNKLHMSQGFNLVISDAETGAEYMYDDCMLSKGSTVVIKRVPAASVSEIPVASGNSAVNHLTALVPSPSHNVNTIDFDDFGNDLYPAINLSSPSSHADVESLNQSFLRVDASPRCQGTFVSRCHKLDRSDIGEYLSRENVGDNCIDIYENMNERKQASKVEEKWMNMNHAECSPTLVNLDLPVELKCSLCNTIFKQAVMMPCCQHSFCYECICSVLFEKSNCPKCSSTKFGISDLLPNLSLRQAIEHFPDSHTLKSDPEKINPKYVPDEESGIHMKDVSYGVCISQREPPVLDSPTATGTGSNLVMTESNNELLKKPKRVTASSNSHIHHLKSDKVSKFSPSGMKQEHTRYENSIPKVLKHVDDAQGEQYREPQNDHQVDEANVITKKSKGFFANTTDFGGSMMPSTRYTKGVRKCYMCGSLEHLVRDCPSASSSYSMFQGGDPMFSGTVPSYGQYCWNNASFPQTMPYEGLYDASGMMPSVVPMTLFPLPSYMPSIYSGLPPSWVPAIPFPQIRVSGLEHPSSRTKRTELSEPQNREWKNTLVKEHVDRGRPHQGNADVREEFHYIDSQRRSCNHGGQSDTNTCRSVSSCDSLRLYGKRSRARYSHRPCYDRSGIQTHEEFSDDSRHAQENHHFSHRKASRTVKRDLSDSLNKERQKHEHKSNPKKHHDLRHSSHLKTQKKTMDFRSMHSRDIDRDFYLNDDSYRDDRDHIKRHKREN